MRGLIRLIIIISAILQSLFFWNIKKRDPEKILIAHDLLVGDTLLLAALMKRIHEKYPNPQKYILAKPIFFGHQGAIKTLCIQAMMKKLIL